MSKDPVKDYITRHLRGMGDELIEIEQPDGSSVTVSRAELLAQKMWDIALGWVEAKPIYDEAGLKVGQRHTYHSPNQSMVRHISDRIEGRPSTQKSEESDERKARRVPTNKRVGDQLKARIDKLAGGDYGIRTGTSIEGKTGKDKASSKNPIPKLRPRDAMSDNGGSDSEGPDKKPRMAKPNTPRLG